MRINSSTHGNTKRIPRRRAARSSFPAKGHTHERGRVRTCAIRFPGPIARHENRLVDCSERQTRNQRIHGYTLWRISVTDEQYIDVTLDRNEVCRNANALCFSMPSSICGCWCLWRRHRCRLSWFQGKRGLADDRENVRFRSRSPKQRAHCKGRGRRDVHGTSVAPRDLQAKGETRGSRRRFRFPQIKLAPWWRRRRHLERQTRRKCSHIALARISWCVVTISGRMKPDVFQIERRFAIVCVWHRLNLNPKLTIDYA